MKINKYYVIFGLILISLISSIILSVKPASEICDINVGCEVVYYSIYNSFLGIQNSYYGMGIFSLLILIMISYFINPTQNKKAIINLSILVGALAALYFLYIQGFVLKAFCQYCLIVDISMILSLILILPELKRGIGFKNEGP
ncbi:MAG: vitamin K epoxide reductase family protein [Candidatus Pacearchaeota archaeon]